MINEWMLFSSMYSNYQYLRMINVLMWCCSLLYFVPLYLRQEKEGKLPLRYYIYTFIAGGILGHILYLLSLVPMLFKEISTSIVTDQIGQVLLRAIFTVPVWEVPLPALLTRALVDECMIFFIGSIAIKKMHCIRKIDYILIMAVAGFGFELTKSLLYAYSVKSAIVAFAQAILASHLMWHLWMGAFYYEYHQAKARGELSFAKQSLCKMFLVPFCLCGMIDYVPIHIILPRAQRLIFDLPSEIVAKLSPYEINMLHSSYISLEALAKLNFAEIVTLAQKYPYLGNILTLQVGSTIVGIIVLLAFSYFTMRMCWRCAECAG